MKRRRRRGRTAPSKKADGRPRKSNRTARSVSGKPVSRVGTRAAAGPRSSSRGAAGQSRVRAEGPRQPAPARPSRPARSSAKSAPVVQGTGGAGRAQGQKARGKRGADRRTAIDPPRGAGGRGQHQQNRPNGLRSKLVGVSPRTVILLILMVIFIVLAVSPVTRNLAATGRLSKMTTELKKEKAVTDSLEKEVSEARSIEYVEREARRQRMVAPGEVLYLVTAGSSESEVKYRAKTLQSMEEAWERVKQLLHSVPR